MIRHSSSFFISIVIHTILLILVLLTYKTYYSQKKEKCETRICVELKALEDKKELIKPLPKVKKIKQKPKKKVIKKLKPKPKKKVIKKQPLIPVVQKIPEPKVVQEEQVIEEIIDVQETKEVQKAIIQPIEKSPQELENERKIKEENIIKEYINLNTQKISQLLRENLYYPRSARKRGVTGKVIVKFRLKADAQVDSIEVIKSKSDILSRSAIKTIKSLSGKFPKPNNDITLHVPIDYSLK